MTAHAASSLSAFTFAALLSMGAPGIASAQDQDPPSPENDNETTELIHEGYVPAEDSGWEFNSKIDYKRFSFSNSERSGAYGNGVIDLQLLSPAEILSFNVGLRLDPKIYAFPGVYREADRIEHATIALHTPDRRHFIEGGRLGDELKFDYLMNDPYAPAAVQAFNENDRFWGLNGIRFRTQKCFGNFCASLYGMYGKAANQNPLRVRDVYNFASAHKGDFAMPEKTRASLIKKLGRILDEKLLPRLEELKQELIAKSETEMPTPEELAEFRRDALEVVDEARSLIGDNRPDAIAFLDRLTSEYLNENSAPNFVTRVQTEGVLPFIDRLHASSRELVTNGIRTLQGDVANWSDERIWAATDAAIQNKDLGPLMGLISSLSYVPEIANPPSGQDILTAGAGVIIGRYLTCDQIGPGGSNLADRINEELGEGGAELTGRINDRLGARGSELVGRVNDFLDEASQYVNAGSGVIADLSGNSALGEQCQSGQQNLIRIVNPVLEEGIANYRDRISEYGVNGSSYEGRLDEHYAYLNTPIDINATFAGLGYLNKRSDGERIPLSVDTFAALELFAREVQAQKYAYSIQGRLDYTTERSNVFFGVGYSEMKGQEISPDALILATGESFPSSNEKSAAVALGASRLWGPYKNFRTAFRVQAQAYQDYLNLAITELRERDGEPNLYNGLASGYASLDYAPAWLPGWLRGLEVGYSKGRIYELKLGGADIDNVRVGYKRGDFRLEFARSTTTPLDDQVAEVLDKLSYYRSGFHGVKNKVYTLSASWDFGID